MKSIVTIICFLLTMTRASTEEPVRAPVTLAVFDFQSPEEGVRDIGPKVSSLINAVLSTDPRLITVERAEFEKTIGEQELGLSGTVSAESAAKVGHLTGARVLVTGRVMKAGNETLIVCKIIGTETTRVVGTTAKLAAIASLADVATGLAHTIGEIVTTNATALLATAKDPEARVARIKAGLPVGKLPVISVQIPEQHFGRPVADPAAQTELLLILQRCGFPITDEKSGTRADYAFEGEAFSERATQKGNLVSCKARVELKLRRLANGELVAADRETSVAVDLSEHVAAKLALQTAARELADRLVPRIR